MKYITERDKSGLWVAEYDDEEPYIIAINLLADPQYEIPLVMGQEIGKFTVTETRMYSIAELRRRCL
jgi:hypothetical protein